VSAIASKTINEFWLNLKFAHTYFKIIYPVNFVFFTVLYFVINISLLDFLIIILSALVLQLISINLIINFRRSEIKQIKNLLKNIAKDKFQSSDDIKLNSSLVEVENKLKAIFERTRQDIASMKKMEQVRTEFLGNVSHELRTPIFAIHGFLETLLNGAIDDPKVNRNFVLKANNHTRHLNNLLNDLIDISMIESRQMRMSFKYFKVYGFLEKIVLMLKPMAREKGLELNLICESNDLELYGDTVRLEQVMINLIQNAIKYTEKGSVDIKVETTSKYGRVIVADSGIGISEADLERVFERFYRVDKGRSKMVGGTGLGLAIVKHIIEAHSSNIEVKSELNKGSEFSFLLKKNKTKDSGLLTD
jgi:two-component system phosphate regulon sensor histidine kinase PhoR